MPWVTVNVIVKLSGLFSPFKKITFFSKKKKTVISKGLISLSLTKSIVKI